MRRIVIHGVIAAAVILVPPGLWYVANVNGPAIVRRNADALSAPLSYSLVVLIVAAVMALAAVAIRRRMLIEIINITIAAGCGGLATMVVALAVLLSVPNAPPAGLRPSPLIDPTHLARRYDDLIGSSIPRNSEPLVRRSWQMDEYGIRSIEGDEQCGRSWQLWEEYGLPMRGFASQYGLGVRRPSPAVFLGDLFTEVLPRLRLLPIGFAINTLIYAAAIIVLPAIPRWIIARHRRQEGRCIRCGYTLRDLRRCPECGWQSTLLRSV